MLTTFAHEYHSSYTIYINEYEIHTIYMHGYTILNTHIHEYTILTTYRQDYNILTIYINEYTILTIYIHEYNDFHETNEQQRNTAYVVVQQVRDVETTLEEQECNTLVKNLEISHLV